MFLIDDKLLFIIIYLQLINKVQKYIAIKFIE
jgi:hypothetical protein